MPLRPPDPCVVVVHRRGLRGPERGLSEALSLLLYLPPSVVSAGRFPPLPSSGERWLSAGERRRGRRTVSIVWGDTWRPDLRDPVQVQRGRARGGGDTPEGEVFISVLFVIFSPLTKVRLVF